jgi:hypothetical protein
MCLTVQTNFTDAADTEIHLLWQQTWQGDDMTETEIKRQRKDWIDQVRQKSVEKFKRIKMSRAVPMTLPQICLYLWGDTMKTPMPESGEARSVGGSNPSPSTQHQTAP